MTQEEKARAYDEALNKAKIEINTKGIGEAVDLCYQLFPQLAENEDEDESEDERIIKWIVNLLHKLHYGPTAQPMALKAIEYLEKQRENPKSTDSIPSDCTAGAKCEDRWHKVVDSLPDNPREVLCKDEAGNYFIGRYYVGEGWEISNYDDEDKPHHLNPPVSKWIDFPSEKQKEQKEESLRDFIDNFPYSDEQKEQKTNYCLYGGEPSVGRCRWCSAACSARLADVHTDEEKEYVRTIKSIISDFIRDKKPENLAYYQKIYDWLDGRHVPFSCGHENDFMSTEWSEEDEKIRRNLMSLLTNMRGDRITEETYQKYYPWLKSLRSSWKPNEEQMEELNKARRFIPYNCDVLESLYIQLKNL